MECCDRRSVLIIEQTTVWQFDCYIIFNINGNFRIKYRFTIFIGQDDGVITDLRIAVLIGVIGVNKLRDLHGLQYRTASQALDMLAACTFNRCRYINDPLGRRMSKRFLVFCLVAVSACRAGIGCVSKCQASRLGYHRFITVRCFIRVITHIAVAAGLTGVRCITHLGTGWCSYNCIIVVR